MSILANCYIKLFSIKVAEDSHGNAYYQSKFTDESGKRKRYVIYNKNNNQDIGVSSQDGYCWLHYLTDDLPTELSNGEYDKEVSVTKFSKNYSGSYVSWKP
ncbi:MAG: NADH-ubiquinone oxidoreductase subunit NDUFA12 family protein [Rickettsiaceae bacterium]